MKIYAFTLMVTIIGTTTYTLSPINCQAQDKEIKPQNMAKKRISYYIATHLELNSQDHYFKGSETRVEVKNKQFTLRDNVEELEYQTIAVEYGLKLNTSYSVFAIGGQTSGTKSEYRSNSGSIFGIGANIHINSTSPLSVLLRTKLIKLKIPGKLSSLESASVQNISASGLGKTTLEETRWALATMFNYQKVSYFKPYAGLQITQTNGKKSLHAPVTWSGWECTTLCQPFTETSNSNSTISYETETKLGGVAGISIKPNERVKLDFEYQTLNQDTYSANLSFGF